MMRLTGETAEGDDGARYSHRACGWTEIFPSGFNDHTLPSDQKPQAKIAIKLHSA
jgi:hypothetical protein